ncbi:MAG: T9SS type A sorting domain-containing protein [Flavobacteriales bacterium]|nr:T9SS type A sorting domain-containing protein [Flavobacteriales bacterium]
MTTAYRSLLLTGVLSIAGTSAAQTVFIPDTNFRDVLYAYRPNYIDTLTGLLDTVAWNADPPLQLGLQLTSWPADSIDLTGLNTIRAEYFNISGGGGAPANITVFPGVPIGVQNFSIDYADVSDVPGMDTLPGMDEFRCFGCGLTELPTFTGPLRWLNMNQVDLSQAAFLWPPGLQSLWLFDSQVDSLPPLPPALIDLRLPQNALTELPPLPAGIHTLWLSANQLDTLPPLPPGLSLLGLTQNPIVQLPPLPATLEDLHISYTLVSELAPLPPGLRMLNCMNVSALTCLPALPNTLYGLYVQGTAVACIPNYPASLDSTSLANAPALCDLGTSPCPIVDPMVSGMVFNDLDGNGIKDVGEPTLAGAVVQVQPGNHLSASAPDGRFNVPAAIGSFTVDGVPLMYHVVTTAAQPVTFTGLQQVDSLHHIGQQAIPGIYDLVIDLVLLPARPGFTNDGWITVHNVGTEPTTAEVQFFLDADQVWVMSAPVATTQSGNGASWSTPVIPVGASWSTMVVLYTNTTVPIGTELLQSATATGIQADTTAANNSVTIPSVVVGSYDPNAKHVEPTLLTAAEVAAGTPVTYTIQFQNTGTFPAARVVVSDTLSEDLQWNSFQFITSSHACTWFVQEGVAWFTFDPIVLPDSISDEPNSHGFVKFSIVPASDLLPGESVANVANIYFDFNVPVITEAAVFAVEVSTAIEDPADDELRTYPNPVDGMIMLSIAGADNGLVEIVDATGRVVRTQGFIGSSTEVDMRSLSPGTFHVRVHADGKILMRSVVKR